MWHHIHLHPDYSVASHTRWKETSAQGEDHCKELVRRSWFLFLPPPSYYFHYLDPAWSLPLHGSYLFQQNKVNRRARVSPALYPVHQTWFLLARSASMNQAPADIKF